MSVRLGAPVTSGGRVDEGDRALRPPVAARRARSACACGSASAGTGTGRRADRSRARSARRSSPCCAPTSPSSRRRRADAARAPSDGPMRGRTLLRTARSRPRGAGRCCRHRRCAGRSARRGTSCSSPNTRYASPETRDPTVTPRSAPDRPRPSSRARSRQGRACWDRSRRARPAGALRRRCRRACRTPQSASRRNTRPLRPRTPGRAR